MRWMTSASSLIGYVNDKTLRLTPDLVWPFFTIRTAWSTIFDPAVGTESKNSIVFRRVTTCAEINVHTVILAQTRVGFLTDGRKESFRELPQDEQLIQLEEAYGCATVTLTSSILVCHYGTTGHKRACWSCHSGWLAYVWGWSCILWGCQCSLT